MVEVVEVVEVVEDVEIGRYVGYGEVEEGMSEFSEQSVSKSVTKVNIELLGQLKMGSLPVDCGSVLPHIGADKRRP